MDPNLVELFEAGSPDDEVAVILRLGKGAEPPPSVRIVCQFGDVATARMRRGDIVRVRQSPGIISLKAGRYVTPPSPFEAASDDGDAYDHEAEVEGSAGPSMPMSAGIPPLPEDGRGVVVGICDWGFDFTHPNFRNADGTTRLQALWDQR